MLRIGEPWRSFKAKWIIDLPIMLVLLNIQLSSACGRAEYRIGVECCPMCSPGNRVHKHCTEFTSTSCVPCTDSTFLDEPNGLTACILCTNCDPGFGLKVKQPCRPSSDSVCETLEGFYCLDPTKNGCRAAQRHSSCKPGQYISHTGTTSTDTVCSDCTGDTYSNGSFTTCQPHTQCDAFKLQQIKPGTHWSDSECGPQTSHSIAIIISAVVVVVVLAVSAAVIGVTIRKRRKYLSETQRPTDVHKGLQMSIEESDTEGATLFMGTRTGMVVRRDCTFESSTSCMPCIRGTFMNEANGLTKCFSCSPCDPGHGLFTQTECKTTSNTVCNVLAGYYCRSYSSNSECSFAVKHTHCSPGQSTKATGTKTTDTMCEECQHGFYSQHGVNCTAWTDCAAMGRVKTEDGNSRQDVICSKVPSRSHTSRIALTLLVGLTVAVLFCFYLARAKRKKELHGLSEIPVQETGPEQVTSYSPVGTAENVLSNVVTD